MAYWILQHNPANVRLGYHSPSAIPSNRGVWLISRYIDRIKINDTAFIWYSGVNRGIYNVSIVISVPPHNTSAKNQIDVLWNSFRNYFDEVEYNRLDKKPRILIEDQYTNDFEHPVYLEELINAGFGDLPVINQFRWGIHGVNQSVGDRLLQYIHSTRGRS